MLEQNVVGPGAGVKPLDDPTLNAGPFGCLSQVMRQYFRPAAIVTPEDVREYCRQAVAARRARRSEQRRLRALNRAGRDVAEFVLACHRLQIPITHDVCRTLAATAVAAYQDAMSEEGQ